MPWRGFSRQTESDHFVGCRAQNLQNVHVNATNTKRYEPVPLSLSVPCWSSYALWCNNVVSVHCHVSQEYVQDMMRSFSRNTKTNEDSMRVLKNCERKTDMTHDVAADGRHAVCVYALIFVRVKMRMIHTSRQESLACGGLWNRNARHFTQKTGERGWHKELYSCHRQSLHDQEGGRGTAPSCPILFWVCSLFVASLFRYLFRLFRTWRWVSPRVRTFP